MSLYQDYYYTNETDETWNEIEDYDWNEAVANMTNQYLN